GSSHAPRRRLYPAKAQSPAADDRSDGRVLASQRPLAGRDLAYAGPAIAARHICRQAFIQSVENRRASIRADACIVSRNDARIRSSRSRSRASAAAIWTYCGGVAAIRAGKPAAVSRLTATRDTCASPASATTGTPIHNASHVVVVPL